MTTRLYYTDAYLASFRSTVVDQDADDRRVYLEHTAFYPTSGGQPNDLGTLDGIAVVDVVDEGERIAHVLDAPLTRRGEAIAGEVDWPRRFDHMQQHTGQHLLSAVLAELFGYQTVSVHFGRDYSSLDLDVPAVGADQLARAEARANEIVWENRPVTVAFEDAATATGLRRESGREGTLRIVTIADLDRSACGGTHVRATGEIGAILLRKQDKVRKAARIEFVCGRRAVARARADFESLSRIAASLSASLEDAPSFVAAQREQLQALETEKRRLEREVAGQRARDLYDATPPGADGVRLAVVTEASGTMDEIRPLAQAFIGLPRAAFVAAVSGSRPPALLVAASEDSGIDAARTLRDALAAAGGRGGGSPRMAQGSVPDREGLARALTAMTRGR
jgi:alanyl-tRNA synthetase